jgi:predicted phage terminase large subunit-like protein
MESSNTQLLTPDVLSNIDEIIELHYGLLEQERRRGLDDLYFFNKYILGYGDMKPRTHRPLCKMVEDKTKRKKHIQFPRGTFKSSVVTIGSNLQDIAKDPNIRILIDNEVYSNSKAFLREIKAHMENERVIELYPQLEPNKRINDGFTEASVIVKHRTKHSKEPTISCAGLDQIKVGMHYDKIVMDDLISNRNVTTKEQINKTIDHYKLALSLLEPGGELIVIGTRYHYSDLYGYLFDNEYNNFYHMILPAVLNEESVEYMKNTFPEFDYGYEVGALLFPERLTEEFLKDQRASQGTYIFNCQYMLDPVNSEDADFAREWLQYYKGYIRKTNEGKWELVVEWVGDCDKRPIEDIQVPFTVPIRIFTTWDPANKKKKKTDFTACSTIGMTPNNDWFVLNLNRDKYNPREIVDRIIREQDDFEAERTGIEEEGKETIKFYLIERMRKLGKFFRLTELKSRGVKKEDRIKRLVPRFENRAIFLPTNITRKTWDHKVINVVEAFEDEYIYFPLAKHDDIIDSLAYMEDMTPKPKGRRASGRRKGRAKYIK